MFSALMRTSDLIRYGRTLLKIMNSAGRGCVDLWPPAYKNLMLETLASIVAETKATWWRVLVASHHRPARVQDITDRYFPGYTEDLLKLAQRDVDLASTEPTLWSEPERRLTATALIARNVFGAVNDNLWKSYYAVIANEGHPETV